MGERGRGAGAPPSSYTEPGFYLEGEGACEDFIGELLSSRSVVSDSATPWTAARQASLSITNSRSLPAVGSWPLPFLPRAEQIVWLDSAGLF